MDSPSTGNRAGRWYSWGCLCLVALTVLALASCFWIESRRGWSVARLEALIAAEVPSDADRRTVEQWFDGHGMYHYYSEDTTVARAGQSTMPMLAGLRDEDLGGMAGGELRGPEANVGFFDSGKITVYFFFDKEGRLVGRLVYPFVYSL